MKALEAVGNGNVLVKRVNESVPMREKTIRKQPAFSTLGHLGAMVTQLANKPSSHLQTDT